MSKPTGKLIRVTPEGIGAVPTSSIVQTTGSSTTQVMSQKAVSDRLNSIESGHGLGYGQTWVDVASERVAGATYTNTTGRPIMVCISSKHISEVQHAKIFVDNITVSEFTSFDASYEISFIVPNSSSYSYSNLGKAPILSWTELR